MQHHRYIFVAAVKCIENLYCPTKPNIVPVSFKTRRSTANGNLRKSLECKDGSAQYQSGKSNRECIDEIGLDRTGLWSV